jgi:F0F1-type ATP synthase delta subunit
MKTSRTRIAGAVADHTLKNGVSKAYATEVAALLLTERRVGDLDSLLRDVQADWAQNGYVEVLARSAHELPKATKKDIASQMQTLYPAAKKVVVTEVHDPSIIGGVQISLSDKQLDLSVEAKLNKFKQLTVAGKDSSQ